MRVLLHCFLAHILGSLASSIRPAQSTVDSATQGTKCPVGGAYATGMAGRVAVGGERLKSSLVLTHTHHPPCTLFTSVRPERTLHGFFQVPSLWIFFSSGNVHLAQSADTRVSPGLGIDVQRHNIGLPEKGSHLGFPLSASSSED